MRYSGTLVRDLQSLAEVCLQWNARICANCGQCYGIHSDSDGLCSGAVSPGGDYVPTSFSELDHEKQVAASAAASNSASFCHSGNGKSE